DSINHQALGSFSYYLRRNLQVWVGDNYRSAKDPTSALNNVFLLLPRADFRENVAHASVEFQPNPLTNVSVEYDTSWAKFGKTDPFQSRILDTRSNGYSLTVARMLSRTQRVAGRYSLYKLSAINTAARNDDVVDSSHPFEKPIHSFSGQYR